MGAYFSRGAISPFFDYSYPINKKDGRIGFSFSSTFAKVKRGEYSWMGLKSNSYIYSLYYDQPLVRKQGFELKSLASLNYKRSRTWSNLGNLFSEAYGFHVDDPIKDTDQVTSIDLGLNMRKDTKYGIWYANQMASMAIPIFDSESSYFKMYGGFLRLHDFSHGIIGQLRGSYQVIPNSKHIPYLDQFQVGGLATVRGYSEGVMLGKSGYFFSGELMFPLLPRTITTKSGETHKFIGHYLKGAIFADTSGVFPYVKEDIYGGSYFLASVGMGVRVQLPGDLSARLYWGYPLINNAYENHRHMGRFHFELTLEPDLDGLLARRKQPEPVIAPPPAPPKELPPVAPPENNYDDIRHYDYLLDGTATAL
jgi:hemolysin activation/secretion protein